MLSENTTNTLKEAKMDMEALKQRMTVLEKSTNTAMVTLEESLVELVNAKIKEIQSKLSVSYEDV